jgi:hypothetical protein
MTRLDHGVDTIQGRLARPVDLAQRVRARATHPMRLCNGVPPPKGVRLCEWPIATSLGKACCLKFLSAISDRCGLV